MRQSFVTGAKPLVLFPGPFAVDHHCHLANGKCLHIDIDGEPAGRIIFKLFDDVVPKLARNFRELVTGQNGFGYKGSRFDQICPMAIQAGTIHVAPNATTTQKSIYGGSFQADNFNVKHDKPGILSMVTAQPSGLVEGSTFQISRYPASLQDCHHAALGEVVTGLEVVERVGELHPTTGQPTRPVVIADCGIIAVNLLLKDPRIGNVSNMIGETINNPSRYKDLLALRGPKAEVMLDIMQKALDCRTIPDELRSSTIKAMMRLCKASGTYPPCLELRGVKLETNPKTSGGAADVWKGSFQGKPVSVKVFRVYSNSNIQELIAKFVAEAIVWCQCTHPNLLPFYGITPWQGSGSRICLVAPWMENGSVIDFLKSNPGAPRLPLIYDLLDGLAYLHHHSIVHGDLTGASILVTPAGSACLADFGVASIRDPDILGWASRSAEGIFGGTMRWEAPELFDSDHEHASEGKPTFKSDIYSVGCVMYEVLTGLTPFYEFPLDVTVMMKVMQGVRPSRPSPSENSELSDDIWLIMQECWDDDPEKRPDVDEANQKIQTVYPGPLILMRWMTWTRKWQQHRVDVLHGFGPHGREVRAPWLSGLEMDTLEKISKHE